MKPLNKNLLLNAIGWFRPWFRQQVVGSLESQFPNYPLPNEVVRILEQTEELNNFIAKMPEKVDRGSSLFTFHALDLFKQIILRYRRFRAGETERLTEKTLNPEIAVTLEKDLNSLDGLASEEEFKNIPHRPLPKLKDFLPIQYIETVIAPFEPRQYDEKFHILQAPNLFLPDLDYLRAKCEDRDTSLAVAFMDIDDFKQFNSKYTETNVDRNLLRPFMRTVEAHVFHHGYAYRQGGDEFLLLVPSVSRTLAFSFLDELRCKLAELSYSEIEEKTTVSIGVCIVEPDCPLTDRELRDRANQAEKFAKHQRKNCIATYDGPRLIAEELRVVKP